MNISVALCTYNGEKFLREQLDSIAAQTLLPYELVVCDDLSRDGTLEILAAFAERVSFPVHVHRNETNLGSTRNFEKAISLCQGEVIALSDQDDLWRPHKLARLAEVLRANPGAGYVFTDAELVDENLRPLGRRLWETIGFGKDLQARFVGDEQFHLFLGQHIVTGATMAFPARIGRMAMPFPTSGNWIHDGWIALFASAAGFPGVAVDEALIAYRQHAAQQIGAPDEPLTRGKGKQSLWRMYQDLQERQQVLFQAWEKNCRQIIAVQGILRQIREKHPSAALDRNLNYLQAYETHYLARRQILTSKKGWGRCWRVLREALSGRYGEFSDSWRSVCRDLFL